MLPQLCKLAFVGSAGPIGDPLLSTARHKHIQHSPPSSRNTLQDGNPNAATRYLWCIKKISETYPMFFCTPNMGQDVARRWPLKPRNSANQHMVPYLGNLSPKPLLTCTRPAAALCTGLRLRSAPLSSHTSTGGNHTSGRSPSDTGDNSLHFSYKLAPPGLHQVPNLKHKTGITCIYMLQNDTGHVRFGT
jgi:hypothetical protein